MKKRQRRLSGFLLACMMVCLPVSQAMAARSVDVSEGAGGQVLFPGDILNNAALPIMKDGAAVGTDTPGSWTNTEEGTVYTASTSEDGSAIILSAAGSVLVVENGTASKNDGSDDSKNHYTFPADEVPSVPQDIAYYQAGETVKIRAAQPQEGMTFAGWTTSSSEVSFGDAASSETTITMPGSRTTVTATYQEVQPDTPAPDPNVSNDPAADPNAGDNTITIDPIATTYTVTVQDGTGEGAYAPGDWVTITAKDYEGKAFNGWYVDNMNATLENAEAQETGFVMPEANVKVSAQYTDVQPVLYGVTINNGIISDETGAVSFAEGATVSVTANDRTQEGLTFAGWFVESRNTEPQDILAMTTSFVMPKGDVVISATYTEAEPPQTDAPQTDAPQT
ncbi:MAG: InlB B-repeat-containing protein, partial [Lachnospiraceae bacterium]|nr:InlB B-repeat-containing protein [Lachnospiraceae bacterium]